MILFRCRATLIVRATEGNMQGSKSLGRLMGSNDLGYIGKQ